MKNKLNRIILSVSVILVTLIVSCLCETVYRWDSHKLIEAINREDITAVEKILQNGTDPNKMDRRPGWWLSFMETSAHLPLTCACRTGNYDIVKLLIDYGASAQKATGTDWSPLAITVLNYYQPDDSRIVKLLLENGADPHFEESGRLPIFWAADMTPKRYDKNKTNGTVFSTGYDEETAKGITQIITILLGNDSINMLNNSDNLLIYASRRENIYLVKYLLAQGCDKDHINSSGKTAYDYALETKNQELIKMLK